MGKLHEVLAVEGDLAGTTKKILEEAGATFRNKVDHFIETATKTEYFSDSDAHLNTQESSALVTTVFDKLKYVAGSVSRYYDAYYVKEATNQSARADVVIDGQVVFKDVPATVLLGMETKLKELRAIYDSIPTLKPGFFWEKDETKAPGTYRSRDPETRFVTKKDVRPIILVAATDKHPAQVEKVSEDKPVAKKTIDTWTSTLSPADKSKLLDNLDRLIREVKKARQRANQAETVDAGDFGEKLFALIHKNVVA